MVHFAVRDPQSLLRPMRVIAHSPCCYPGRSGEVVGFPHLTIHIFLNVEGDVRDGATERARLGIFRSNKPRSPKTVLGFPMGKCGGAAQIQ